MFIPFGTRRWTAVLLLVPVLLLSACGGGDESKKEEEQQRVVTSGVKQRALVANEFNLEGSNFLHIVDAATDTMTFFRVRLGTGPRMMVTAGGRTLVFASNQNILSLVENSEEREIGRAQLSGVAESIALSPDGKIAYAAVRSTGQVVVADFSSSTPTLNIVSVPTVRNIVLNRTGTKLLAFSDDTNSLTVINTSDRAATTVAGFDRPIYAVFPDDTRALVLSCGAECGGTQARVTQLDLSGSTPTVGTGVAVSGATVGLIEGGNLYVAGSPGNSGRLDVLNASTLAVVRAGVVIGDGFHNRMLVHQGKLFIGARTCTNNAGSGTPTGCLSIVSVASQSAVITPARGFVTGMAAVPGRNVVYVTEGGELHIYDTTTDDLLAGRTINIVGRATDVVVLP